MHNLPYFAYGSNMNLVQMKTRCPDSKKIAIGYMQDAEICFPSFYESWNGGVAGFKHSLNHKMWGVLFEVSESDLEKLRVFEGFEKDRQLHLNDYNEILIDVIVGDETRRCMTYEARTTGNFRPSLRYLQTIVRGAEDNELPEDYIEELGQLL